MKTEAPSSIDVFEGFEGESALRNLHLFSRQLRALRDRTQRERHSEVPRAYIYERPASQRAVRERCRAIATKLCDEHPAISTDKEILGGKPHVKGTRLSVGTVLAKLYLYGSIQAILDIYEPHLSEEQVKEAIAYAQDFLEKACGANEP